MAGKWLQSMQPNLSNEPVFYWSIIVLRWGEERERVWFRMVRLQRWMKISYPAIETQVLLYRHNAAAQFWNKNETNNWTFLNNKFPLSRIILILNFPANKYVIILYIDCTCTLYYRYYWYFSNTKDSAMNNIYLLIIRYD